MRNGRIYILLLPLIFVFIFLTTSCDRIEEIFNQISSLEKEEQTTPSDDQTTDNPTVETPDIDASDMTGTLTLLSEEQKIQWQFEDGDEQASLTAKYGDASLSQVMDFMGFLAQDGWYLVENSAYKGARSLDITYSMDTRTLGLNFTLDKNKAEWPPDVLTPYLDYQTPAFPFGQYLYEEEHQESVGGADSTMVVYEGVDQEDIGEYEQMLLDDGYVHGDDPNIEFYEKGFCFVEIAFHEKSGQVGLFVGQYEISPVSLPPWPSDELPEFLVRILSPVSAVITVTGGEDQIFVSAEKMSLNDLYGFFKASEEYYGWTALSGKDEMIHQETGFGILVRSYDSDTQVWTLVIFDATQPNSTQEPDATPSPDMTKQPDNTQPSATVSPDDGDDEIGVTEFGYRVTKGRYSEKDAMMGVLEEYGQFAEMADWNDIKALYGDDITAFLDEAGVKVDVDVWVQYGGQRFDGDRHYFLARISAPREDFLLYDKIGNKAWLGSWYGIEMPVLVKVPSDQL